MDRKTLSIGKLRGLQRLSTGSKAIALLAVDHRNNLRSLIKPDAPGSVADEELVTLKKLVVSELGGVGSGVLLDPQYGAAQSIAAGVLPSNKGLVVAIEATGYGGEPTRRLSERLTGWSAAKARKMGADGVKLLVYYHPQSAAAPDIEDLVSGIAEECKEADLPLFLETLSYSLDPYSRKLTSPERHDVVIESIEKLGNLGADVFEAEFPVDPLVVSDEVEMVKACEELSSACPIPWILISGSAKFYDYLRQVNAACQGGASGVAVGRAIWQDIVPLDNMKRREYLQQVIRPRMERLTALCNAISRPWSDFYTSGEPATDWYRNY